MEKTTRNQAKGGSGLDLEFVVGGGRKLDEIPSQPIKIMDVEAAVSRPVSRRRLADADALHMHRTSSEQDQVDHQNLVICSVANISLFHPLILTTVSSHSIIVLLRPSTDPILRESFP